MCVGGGMDKEVITHTHTHTHIMEYYLALKTKGILLLATTWMSLEDIKLTEKKKSEREGKVISLTHVIYKRKLIETKSTLCCVCLVAQSCLTLQSHGL